MSSWLVVVMMIASGAFMAFQAPLNARLRGHVGALESSLISFCVGTFILAVAVACTGKGSLGGIRNVSWWELLGGLIGAIFVTTSLLSSPVIGVTGIIVAALAGQLAMALVIDGCGLVGMEKKPLDLHRIAGLGLLVVAVLLINWNSWKKPA